MKRNVVVLITVILTAAASLTWAGAASPGAVIWAGPGSIARRDLFYGPGGRERQPQGKFRFLEEDKDGGSPKFEVEDGRGVKWKVKVGEEARPETAATRLLWGAGYFTDEVYYLPEMRVEGLRGLSRGAEFVAPGGRVRGARLERKNPGEKKVGEWSWFKNPFVGTKELNGLRVIMALINNWDLKETNNSVYELPGGERRYLVSDLGATFGKTGDNFGRSKGDLVDYLGSKFIEELDAREVDFVLHSRPFFLLAVNAPYYRERAKMEAVVEDIPLAHARWIGQVLGQLTPRQLNDAFRAAGYTPAEVRGYTGALRQRIARLKAL